MGLFSRFKRAVKANVDSMISKAENPEKVLNHLITEMHGQLIEAKKSVALAIADEKKMERLYNQQIAQSKEWERKAILALDNDREDLAKEALLRKQEYDRLAKQYKEQWEAQHSAVEELKGTLRQLQQQIEEAQRKKNMLIARVKRAEAQKKVQSTITELDDTSAFEAFDQMTAKVEQIEAEADALKEMEKARQEEDTIEKQFEALEYSEASADILLADLKAKMARLEDQRRPYREEDTENSSGNG
ncbi:Phage shock protein A [subsurface metagenome]